jgi:hypothetical protein
MTDNNLLWILLVALFLFVIGVIFLIHYLVRRYRWGQCCNVSPIQKSNLVPAYLQIDVKTDPNNCGLLDTRCRTAVGETCVNGVCVCENASFTQCADGCVNIKWDVNNCGACGVTCRVGESCINGTCSCTGDSTLCGNQCVNLSDDRLNCGGCRFICPDGKVWHSRCLSVSYL